MTEEVKQRKIEHVTTSLHNDVSAPQSASWMDVKMVHQALPEVDLDQMDLSVSFLGKRLSYPILVSSLTGGHPDLATINSRLAMIAQEYGLAMGVGSQRAALVNPSLASTYQVVREKAPGAFLIANIGVPQLIAQQSRPAFTLEQVKSAIRMIDADALALHMNFLQEAAQPEGDRKAKGCLAASSNISGSIDVPVIAKETGAGVSYEQARALKASGASAIDVGVRVAAAWPRWRACVRSLWVTYGAHASVSSSGIGVYLLQLRWCEARQGAPGCTDYLNWGVFAAVWMLRVRWRWAQAWSEWAFPSSRLRLKVRQLCATSWNSFS